MPPLDVIGEDEMTRVSHREVWTQLRGSGFRSVWVGPEDKAREYYDDRVNDDDIDDLELDIDGGKGTVTITSSETNINGGTLNTQALNTVWELIGQDFEKDIRQHPTFSEYADPDLATAQKALVQVWNEYEKGNFAFAPAAGEPTTMRNILRRGYTNYMRSLPILRMSVAVSRRSDLSASWAGVDRAWTISSETESPDPPTELLGTIASMPDADATKKQWLKRAPQVRQVGRHDYSIVQEWWFADKWSFLLYEGTEESDGSNP